MREHEHRGAALRKAALCLLIAGSVGSDCYDATTVGPSFERRVPARRATATAHAIVPQGTWNLSLGCGVADAESFDLGYVSSDRLVSHELHCPRGMCPFDFPLSCYDYDEDIVFQAKFEFVSDGGGGGCSDRDPRYVETKDYDFFEVEFELEDVEICRSPGAQGDLVPNGALGTARSVTYIDCEYDDDWGDGDGDGDAFPDAGAEEDGGADGGSALDGGDDAGNADAGDDAGNADAGDGGQDA